VLAQARAIVPSKATDKTDRFIRKISGARGRVSAPRGVKAKPSVKVAPLPRNRRFPKSSTSVPGALQLRVHAVRDLEGQVWSFGQSIGKFSRADAGWASGLTMGG